MKFVKYPKGGHKQISVHEINPFRNNFHSYQRNMTHAESDMFRGYEDEMRIEDVYWDYETKQVVMLAVDYFGVPLFARFPSWAVYYDAMLNHILGPV
jgi:hypothetical protein